MTETYSIITDFPSGLNEIQLKELILIQLPTCTDVGRVGDEVNITFTSQISPSEKVTLDNIISSYTYSEPLVTPNLYLMNGIMKSDISNDTFTFLGNQPDEIHISKTSQTHYPSIKAAIAANNTNNIVFIVHPGTYVEDNPLILPDGCCLLAAGNAENTTILAQNSNTDILQLGIRCKVAGLTLAGGSRGIYFDGTQSGGYGRFSAVFETYVIGCNVGLEIDGKNFNGAMDTLYLREILIVSTTYTLDKGIYCHSGGQIISSGVNIAGNPSFQITHGIYSYGSGSKISMTTSAIWFCTNAIYIDNSGEVEIQLLTAKYCDTSLNIGPTGTESKINGELLNSLNSTNLDINVEASDAILDIQSGIIDILKIVNPNNVKLNARFQSTQYGAYYQNILGDVVLGTKRVPAKIAVGEGTYDIDGVYVFTNDNLEVGAWTDCTAGAYSLGSPPFNIFSGVTAGNCLYIGRSTNPLGAKISVTVATSAPVGASDLVWEYWNGTTWVEFTVSETSATPPFYFNSDSFISNVGKYQIRFGITATTAFVSKVLNGQNKNWVRLRIVNDIPSIPVGEYCKLHVSATEIDSDGFTEYFGNARQVDNFKLFQTVENTEIFMDSNLSSSVVKEFPDGVLSKISTISKLPTNLDIGFPLKVNFSIIGDNNTPGDVYFKVYYGKTNTNSSVFLTSTLTNNEQSLTKVVSIAESQKETRGTFSLDVSKFLTNLSTGENDLLWLTIERDGTNIEDTYSGNIFLIHSDVKYIKFYSGGHILSF